MRSRYTIREPGVPLLHHLHRGPMDSPFHPETPISDILIDTLQFCRQHKGLNESVAMSSWTIVISTWWSPGRHTCDANSIRDFKSYTAKLLIARLEQDQKTWVLNQFQYYKQPNQDQ